MENDLTPEERELLIQFTNDIGSFGLKWLFANDVNPSDRAMMERFIKFMRDAQALRS